jgi:hypothetical protein
MNILERLLLQGLHNILKTSVGMLAVVTIISSCASGPGPRRQSGNLWCDKDCIYKTRWTYTDLSGINGKSPNDYYVKGVPKTHIGYQTPVGLNKVEVKTLWTNQFTDYTELPLDVKEGRSYVVFSYELEQGQDPNTANPCVAPPKTDMTTSGGQPIYAPLFGKDGKSWGKVIASKSGNESLGEVIAKETAGFMVDTIELTAAYFLSPFLLSAYFIEEISKAQKARKTAAASQDNTANTETQLTDNNSDTPIQPLDSTLDTATKPEDAAVAKVSKPAEPPPAPIARPFDGCCYVWIEDFETREVVAGTRPTGAGR